VKPGDKPYELHLFDALGGRVRFENLSVVEAAPAAQQ
jgi:hypothetical protein